MTSVVSIVSYCGYKQPCNLICFQLYLCALDNLIEASFVERFYLTNRLSRKTHYAYLQTNPEKVVQHTDK